MIAFPVASHCRLSGEPLADATVLFEVTDCPLPGIYPASVEEARGLRSPLRVVQARHSGHVQLAHVCEAALYAQYSFAGGVSGAYRQHLESVAAEIARELPPDAAILEVGCGDGWLVRRLRDSGFRDVLGIDPGRAASGDPALVTGYFPDDLPAAARARRYDLIVCRHVLEHIETPRAFVAALAAALAPGGQLWIEVPDLDSTLARGWWSNFYQLHCSYFSAATLDRLCAEARLRCGAGRLVDVFGGSLVRQYVVGDAPPVAAPPVVAGVAERIGDFRAGLRALAAAAPRGTAGYGAAERTAVTLGLAPELEAALGGLFDGNPLLTGRFLAGTALPIASRAAFRAAAPPAVVLFAISNAREIFADWKRHLPPSTLVARAGLDRAFRPLEESA